MKKTISINSVAELEAGDVIISRSDVDPGVHPWAVEREVPEYAPATVATADVWTDRTQQRLRVFRIPGAWIDEHGEIWQDAAPNRQVDEIVPDVPEKQFVSVVRELPSREQVEKAIGVAIWDRWRKVPSKATYAAADAVLALLTGERS